MLALGLLLTFWLLASAIIFVVFAYVYSTQQHGRKIIRKHKFISLLIIFGTSLTWPIYVIRLLWKLIPR